MKKKETKRVKNNRQAAHFDCRLRLMNRALSAERIVEILKNEAPGFWNAVAIVGKWVWLEIPAPYSRSEANFLWQLGFHFSPARRCFQHPGGQMTDAVSNDDPREPTTAWTRPPSNKRA